MIDERQALRHERAALYETVRDLSPAEWDAASLCEGWRVRDVIAHVNLGVLLQNERKDVDGAIEAYRAAIEADPGHANAHNTLGALLGGHGRHARASPAPGARFGGGGPPLLRLHRALSGSEVMAWLSGTGAMGWHAAGCTPASPPRASHNNGSPGSLLDLPWAPRSMGVGMSPRPKALKMGPVCRHCPPYNPWTLQGFLFFHCTGGCL